MSNYPLNWGFDSEIGSKWTYDAYFQHGENENHQRLFHNMVGSLSGAAVKPYDFLRWALDAVVNPANPSQIVCRATIPGDPTFAANAAGCVPLNLLGNTGATEGPLLAARIRIRRGLLRGLRQRCPNCGQGALFGRYLKINPVCSACGLELGEAGGIVLNREGSGRGRHGQSGVREGGAGGARGGRRPRHAGRHPPRRRAGCPRQGGRSPGTLPPGLRMEWVGEFGNLKSALQRLAIAVPIAVAMILLLLYVSFGNLRDTLLAGSAIPMALIGGVLALFGAGMPFSISAAIGFVALFGIAAMNGIMVVSCYNRLIDTGHETEQALRETCAQQMRPVLMTCVAACVGLLPAAFSSAIGSQVQRPLAIVVVGGMMLAPIVILVTLPVLTQPWVTPATPDGVFAELVKVGTNGDRNRTAFSADKKAAFGPKFGIGTPPLLWSFIPNPINTKSGDWVSTLSCNRANP